jgi:hypothetical protein
LYPQSGISNEEEFRNAVKVEIGNYYDKQSRNQLHDQIYHHLVDDVQISFPESFLKRWLQEGGEKTRSQEEAEQERVVRETYRKLETYNAAAQIFQNEMTNRPIRAEVNLSFELTAFRYGLVAEILNQRYAGLVTLPTGDVVSLTRGGHSLDGGPQEATFGAQWEHGQYAAVFDPVWTVADVFHFEAARYYDIRTYVAYQVTVKMDGRSRTYQALALFHEPREPGDVGAPEFWVAIVNGIGGVW